ncbi:ATP-binding cassette domain-containing protein [Flavobacteriaceae bacterium]|jgi:phospholipid/cholesterol/gamma-HCH transport system ATP-binding protein|nr:ATP-binding cassette domain-containing protein [Flavobacteriaceae bacterium]
MIEIKNLVKQFSGKNVLNDISAVFEDGQTSLIIGQSGSGKTVLMKCMLGLYEIDQGCICYDGLEYQRLSIAEQNEIRKQIGMVFQGSALFDSMDVLENVLFPLSMLRNMSRSEMEDRANQVLKRVNLLDAHHKMPSEISGGMQKRVAIARAIVMNPRYLFCDEPNSGLDPKTAILIDNLIQEITQEYNITTVINTHDMNSVMEIGDKIIFLKNGVLAWEGNSDLVFRTDNQAVTEFVYSSELFKKVREATRAQSK